MERILTALEIWEKYVRNDGYGACPQLMNVHGGAMCRRTDGTKMYCEMETCEMLQIAVQELKDAKKKKWLTYDPIYDAPKPGFDILVDDL